jgi:hypothetical protein
MPTRRPFSLPATRPPKLRRSQTNHGLAKSRCRGVHDSPERRRPVHTRQTSTTVRSTPRPAPTTAFPRHSEGQLQQIGVVNVSVATSSVNAVGFRRKAITPNTTHRHVALSLLRVFPRLMPLEYRRLGTSKLPNKCQSEDWFPSVHLP